MKKICCLFIACIMIFTGLSMPAFAVRENVAVAQGVYDIADISEKCINALRKKVDDDFYSIVGLWGGRLSTGAVFNDMCIADLLSRYYAINGQINESRMYEAKEYLLSSRLITCSLSNDNKENLFAKYELSMYYLDKASNCLQKDDDELYDVINTERIFRRSNFLIEYAACDNRRVLQLNIDEVKEALQIIYDETPKNEEQFYLLLEAAGDLFNVYNSKIFKNNRILKNKNFDFNLEQDSDESDNSSSDMEYEREEEGVDKLCSENLKCSLSIDDSSVYYLRDILKTVLSGNFNIGHERAHIGFGALINN